VDDLENPNLGPASQEALRAVRERKHLEENERRKLRWPNGADWVLMLGVPIVVTIIAVLVEHLG
jgi:hypothetical protein